MHGIDDAAAKRVHLGLSLYLSHCLVLSFLLLSFFFYFVLSFSLLSLILHCAVMHSSLSRTQYVVLSCILLVVFLFPPLPC
jgi:hypothetical protein